MKKRYLALALMLAPGLAMAHDQVPAQGGFVGPSQGTITTVSVALTAPDDTAVTLTGHILSSLGNEKYQFKDATGEMTIEIDHKDFNGLTITPESKVMIKGEVDKEWSTRTIDVDMLSIVK
ncbi:YgiW/YdeI family stress tolerance OB fold protein [Shewanella marina]|uniref:YgiW/YdeI family stress tolerance OB fold protein n=1 Tax=Shewanella marina TaxID=487319 RepID=UPI00047217B0|nr:NirD/YgiW/YdeI family stress tolerance protein [Shewanella marina]